MATIKIYGSSDDLVEVEGDLPGCDEYGSFDKPKWVELSTGDVFKVEYTDKGVWAVDHIKKTNKVVVAKEPHGEGDDPDPYTETANVTGKEIKWVEVWGSWPQTTESVKFKLEDEIGLEGNHLPSYLSPEDVHRIWDIVITAKRKSNRT